MTDLPRYHKGGLGPLDFQTINEAFRRLDALRPLIETAGLKQDGGIAAAPPTVVRANKIERRIFRRHSERGSSV